MQHRTGNRIKWRVSALVLCTHCHLWRAFGSAELADELILKFYKHLQVACMHMQRSPACNLKPIHTFWFVLIHCLCEMRPRQNVPLSLRRAQDCASAFLKATCIISHQFSPCSAMVSCKHWFFLRVCVFQCNVYLWSLPLNALLLIYSRPRNRNGFLAWEHQLWSEWT